MAFRLKSSSAVAADPARDGYRAGLMVVHTAGTPLESIPEYELRQLAPAHFVGVDDDDGALPDDWRSAEAQDQDERQREFLAEHIRTHVTPREG